MSSDAAPILFDWVKDIGLPVGGFIAGFFTSRWTLTKKDRKDVEQKNFENTAKLIEQHDAAYAEYTKALTAYFDAPRAVLDNFVDIATKGDRYFIQLNSWRRRSCRTRWMPVSGSRFCCRRYVLPSRAACRSIMRRCARSLTSMASPIGANCVVPTMARCMT